jgi:hypothetical protein
MNQRNSWNALNEWPSWAKDLDRAAQQAGAYETGIVSDKRQRGTAINVDLFGFEEEQGLIVVQVRQAVFHPRRHTEVRKNYLLIGRNEETGGVFAHPVDSPARSKKALETPQTAVAYVLAKVWGCRVEDLPEIHRQGDIAFVPVRSVPADATEVQGPVVLRGTHKITGDKILRSGDTYYVVKRGHLSHTKRQHAPVTVRNGFYRVQEGNRASLWGFSLQKGD